MTWLVLVGGLLLAPVVMSGCVKPIAPVFEVVLAVQPVAVASNVHVSDLAAMAASHHAPLRHPAYGYYVGTFGYLLKVINLDHSTGACPHSVKVHVLVGLAGRHIEIAQELKQSPCLYERYLSHYRKHAASDVAVVAEYRARVERALCSIIVPIQDSGVDSENRIYRIASEMIDRTLEPLTPDRAAIAKRVDSPSEIERLEHHSCEQNPNTSVSGPI